jgi:hypothetical protein
LQNQNAPTVKSKRGVVFYNPGDRFTEVLNYSLDGIGDIHAIARWTIDAEDHSAFHVPTELTILADGQRVGVDFPTTVIQRFKNRGVLMIDEEYEIQEDEDQEDQSPFAKDMSHAEEKGKRLWIRFLQSIVRNHIESVGRARAVGGIPMEASGFTKRAFKLLGMKDPAAVEFQKLAADAENAERQLSGSGDTSKLESIVAEQAIQLKATQEMVTKLLAKLEAKEQIKNDAEIEDKVAAKTRTASEATEGEQPTARNRAAR